VVVAEWGLDHQKPNRGGSSPAKEKGLKKKGISNRREKNREGKSNPESQQGGVGAQKIKRRRRRPGKLSSGRKSVGDLCLGLKGKNYATDVGRKSSRNF